MARFYDLNQLWDDCLKAGFNSSPNTRSEYWSTFTFCQVSEIVECCSYSICCSCWYSTYYLLVAW